LGLRGSENNKKKKLPKFKFEAKERKRGIKKKAFSPFSLAE